MKPSRRLGGHGSFPSIYLSLPGQEPFSSQQPPEPYQTSASSPQPQGAKIWAAALKHSPQAVYQLGFTTPDPRDVTHLPGLSWIDGTMKTAPCGPGGTAVGPPSPTRNPHSYKLGATCTSSLGCPQACPLLPRRKWGSEGKTEADGLLRSQRKFQESLVSPLDSCICFRG